MKQSLIELIDKIGMKDELSYFEDASFSEKITYHSQSKSLKIKIHLKRALPFETWRRFISQLTKATQSKIDLELTSDENEMTIQELKYYIEYFCSITPGLKVFSEYLPMLEKNIIIYSYNDEKLMDEAILNKHKVEAFLAKIGFNLPILVKQFELNAATPEVKLNVAPSAPSVVYEEKKLSFEPKKKKMIETILNLKLKKLLKPAAV